MPSSATINAGAVISSTAAGPNFNYAITLTNASSSSSGIGTFWYAWVPGQDFLATSPLSVSPPPGWTDNITNAGAGDGFAIQFLANSPANDLQPGSSLNFSFTSADCARVGEWQFGVPPRYSGGHRIRLPAGPIQRRRPSIRRDIDTDADAHADTDSAATPPVTVVSVETVKGKKHLATEIVVDLSGPVNAARADNVAHFLLRTANGKGSFTARNSPVTKLRSAVFNPANDTITLTPRKAFSLTKPVQLTIKGTSASGLQDSSGRLIDGDANGVAGGNAVAVIRRSGVTLNPRAPAPTVASLPARSVVSHPAPSLVTHLSQPVSVGATPPPQPVNLMRFSPAQPVGFQPISYAVFDAALDGGERMI